MLYDSDPNNAGMMMKYDSFHSMNPIYGKERKISKSSQYYNAMHNFLSDVNANNHISMNNLYMSFSNTSINSKIWFSMFSEIQKTIFWKKNLLFTFQKELSLYQWESVKSNHKESRNNNPINSFNERKNKEQTNESSQCKWKCSFTPMSKWEKPNA